VRAYVGIDLGSTTTKAVVLDEDGTLLGRGITNSRSNYAVACDVALSEALINARFGLIAGELDRSGLDDAEKSGALSALDRLFRKHQYLEQLRVFAEISRRIIGSDLLARDTRGALDEILASMEAETPDLYAAGATRKSDFFRDLAGSRYLSFAEGSVRSKRVGFDRLVGLFDKTILEVENVSAGVGAFEAHAIGPSSCSPRFISSAMYSR